MSPAADRTRKCAAHFLQSAYGQLKTQQPICIKFAEITKTINTTTVKPRNPAPARCPHPPKPRPKPTIGDLKLFSPRFDRRVNISSLRNGERRRSLFAEFLRTDVPSDVNWFSTDPRMRYFRLNSYDIATKPLSSTPPSWQISSSSFIPSRRAATPPPRRGRREESAREASRQVFAPHNGGVCKYKASAASKWRRPR